MKTDEELRRGIIEDEACEEAYIAACEEVGPNSPEFDRVYDDHYEKEMERMSDSKSDGYEKLWEVLKRAGEQASLGKGKERHSETQGVFRPFHEQPICSIGRMVGTGYNIGQGMKKGHEARELPQERAVDELLGAINYFASAVILMEEQPSDVSNSQDVPSYLEDRDMVKNWTVNAANGGAMTSITSEKRGSRVDQEPHDMMMMMPPAPPTPNPTPEALSFSRTVTELFINETAAMKEQLAEKSQLLMEASNRTRSMMLELEEAKSVTDRLELEEARSVTDRLQRQLAHNTDVAALAESQRVELAKSRQLDIVRAELNESKRQVGSLGSRLAESQTIVKGIHDSMFVYQPGTGWRLADNNC